jgi:hypothetical protein
MIPSEISEITESSDTTCHCRSGVLIISECKMKLASNPSELSIYSDCHLATPACLAVWALGCTYCFCCKGVSKLEGSCLIIGSSISSVGPIKTTPLAILRHRATWHDRPCSGRSSRIRNLQNWAPGLTARRMRLSHSRIPANNLFALPVA